MRSETVVFPASMWEMMPMLRIDCCAGWFMAGLPERGFFQIYQSTSTGKPKVGGDPEAQLFFCGMLLEIFIIKRAVTRSGLSKGLVHATFHSFLHRKPGVGGLCRHRPRLSAGPAPGRPRLPRCRRGSLRRPGGRR